MDVDPERVNLPETRIYCRALTKYIPLVQTARWGSHDIAHLTKESLLAILSGKPREWSIDVVGIMLGHGHIVPKPNDDEKPVAPTAFNDWTCDQCHRRFATTGDVDEQTRCPHCGHVHDTSKTMKTLERLRREMLEEGDLA